MNGARSMTHWHQLLQHVILTTCGRKLSTLQDIAEYASHRDKRPWKYAAECARLASMSKDTDAVREATIAAQNAVLLDELTGAKPVRSGKSAA